MSTKKIEGTEPYTHPGELAAAIDRIETIAADRRDCGDFWGEYIVRRLLLTAKVHTGYPDELAASTEGSDNGNG